MNYLRRPVLMGSVKDFDPAPHINASCDVKGKEVAAYSIAHRGRFTPFIYGMGRVVLSFTGHALASVLEALPLRTMAFENHDIEKGLDHYGRNPVAEVVGKTIQTLNGEKHALAILAFDPGVSSAKYPAISLEAEGFDFDDSGTVHGVQPITGLALLPHGVKPAFPQAMRAGQPVFCGPVEGPMILERGGITLEDAKEYIRKHGVSPTAIFDSNSILGDILIGDDGKVSFDGGEKIIRDILNKKFKGRVLVEENELSKLKDQSKRLGEIEKPFAELRQKDLISHVKATLPAKAKEMNLSETLQKYLLGDAQLKAVAKLEGEGDKVLADYINQGTETYKSLVEQGLIKESGSAGGQQSENTEGEFFPV